MTQTDHTPEYLLECLQKEINQNKPVIVKLSATNCGPCRIYEKAWQEFKDSDSWKPPLFAFNIANDAVYDWMKKQTQLNGVPITLGFSSGMKRFEKIGPLTVDELRGVITELAKPLAVPDADL